MPGIGELAVVAPALAAPKVTVPGPLIWLQVVVNGAGRPSSVTVPLRLALAGRGTDSSFPALTPGGVFPGGLVGGVVISYNLPSTALGSLLLSMPRSTM